MKKKILVFIVLGILVSCKNENKPVATNTKSTDNKLIPLEEMVERHIEVQLSIPATEKYTYTIHKAHLDEDKKIDAIIAVNRLAYAMDVASKSKNTAREAELGYMGNYNHIFFFDGGLHKISPPISIPSSPLKPLTVEFKPIYSEKYNDILIDFRIKNASFKDFYTVHHHLPRRIFQWKNFDGLGQEKSEAFHFEYGEGTIGAMQDILVKKSILEQPTGEVDVTTYVPKLTPTDELVYRFFYHPTEKKYMTLKK
jgi:hypothetical protein